MKNRIQSMWHFLIKPLKETDITPDSFSLSDPILDSSANPTESTFKYIQNLLTFCHLYHHHFSLDYYKRLLWTHFCSWFTTIIQRMNLAHHSSSCFTGARLRHPQHTFSGSRTVLPGQSWTACGTTDGPIKPAIFTIQSFTENFAKPWSICNTVDSESDPLRTGVVVPRGSSAHNLPGCI